MKVSAGWTKKFFNNSFYNPVSYQAKKAAKKEAAFLYKALGLKKGNTILDLCCGPGRHALEFAQMGLEITGYDFSQEYLAEAVASAAKQKLNIEFEKGDMRKLKYAQQFDAAINLFNSFGYFINAHDDLKTICGISRALKNKGKLAIDIINGTYMRNFTLPRDWLDLGDCWRLDETEFNKQGMNCSWTFIDKKTGKARSANFFNRLYDRNSLSALLKKAKLKPIAFYGDFDGAKLTDNSERIIAIAIKN